jgi:hypothetical protein
MHPLASRYVQSIQQLRSRLSALTTSNNKTSKAASNPHEQTSRPALPSSATTQSQLPTMGNQYPPQEQTQDQSLDLAYVQDAYQPGLSDMSLRAGLEDEFSNIESMLMDSTGWTGLMDDWTDNPVGAQFIHSLPYLHLTTDTP